MYYICIENGKLINVFNYKPNTPNTVTVIEISNDEFNKVQNNTHYFDIKKMRILPNTKKINDIKKIQQKNKEALNFLQSTDWMVLRHLRQQFLKIKTSLSEDEYKNLELKRNKAASEIVNN